MRRPIFGPPESGIGAVIHQGPNGAQLHNLAHHFSHPMAARQMQIPPTTEVKNIRLIHPLVEGQ